MSSDVLHLWRPGKPSGTLPFVLSAKFSGDGFAILCTMRDKTLQVWDGVSGSGRKIDGVEAAIGPDGKRILTLSKDGTLSLVSEVGRESKVLLYNVSSVEFVGKTGRFLSTSKDGSGRLWTLDGSQSQELCSTACQVAVASDGLHVLTYQENMLRLWRHGISEPTVLSKNVTSDYAFSKDADRILAIVDDTVHIWKSDGQPLQLSQSISKVDEAKFSPDGRYILTVSEDEVARVWSINGTPLGDVSNHVETAKFTADGSRIVTEGTDDDGNVVRIWRLGWNQIVEHLASSVRAAEACLSVEDRTWILGEPVETARRQFETCSQPQKSASEQRPR
jgi:WD40 repeat protein